MNIVKKILSKTPNNWITELKRIHFGRQIKRGIFDTEEPEGKILRHIISPGDWVIDIGANVGHYTKRFSDIVGPQGRVIAFEPVPTTFSLLSSNTQLFNYPNVTLLNAAVSDKMAVAGISIPKTSTGLVNFYQAQLADCENSALSVLTLTLDSLCINQRVSLIKIDAEGHESSVLSGMQKLMENYHPFIILETDSEEVIERLVSLRYIPEKLPESPNVLFKPCSSLKIFKDLN